MATNNGFQTKPSISRFDLCLVNCSGSLNPNVHLSGPEMNPYEPSGAFTPNTSFNINHVATRRRNPAKRYLIVCAALCLIGAIGSLWGLIEIRLQGPARGLFVQAMAFAALSVFCVTSAYLAFGDFGKANRLFTIVWALVAAMGIAFVVTYVDPIDPTDVRNLPGLIVLGGGFAFLGYIAWLCTFANAKQLTPDIMTAET